MTSVTLSDAVFMSLSLLPITAETEVSELKVTMSSLSCHYLSKWLLSLERVYKVTVTWKHGSGSQQKHPFNVSVSDFIDVLEVRVTYWST